MQVYASTSAYNDKDVKRFYEDVELLWNCTKLSIFHKKSVVNEEGRFRKVGISKIKFLIWGFNILVFFDINTPKNNNYSSLRNL